MLLRAPAAYDSDSFEHDGGSVPGLGGDEDESDGGHGGGEASDDSLRSLRSGSTSGDEEEALGDAGANGERRTAEALPKARETRPAPSPRVFGRKAPASRGADGSKASSARTSAADRNPASTSNEVKAKGKASPAKASPAATKKKRVPRGGGGRGPREETEIRRGEDSEGPGRAQGQARRVSRERRAPEGRAGQKNRERVEQGLEPELASLKKPKKPKRPKTQAEAAREARRRGHDERRRPCRGGEGLAKGPIVKRAAAEAAAAAKAAADAAAAEAAAKATPPRKSGPGTENHRGGHDHREHRERARDPEPVAAAQQKLAGARGAGVCASARRPLDNAEAGWRGGAAARARRRWEKPLDLDAGYDDDFAIFEFGDGTPTRREGSEPAREGGGHGDHWRVAERRRSRYYRGERR